MKVCKKCGIRKVNDCFHKCKKNKDGLHSYCKECSKAYSLTHYKPVKKEKKVIAKKMKRASFMVRLKFLFTGVL